MAKRKQVDSNTCGDRSHGCRRRNALTLVELLVTLSVLLIILGFLLPALMAARESSRRAGCLNNLAQIGKGMTGYDTNHGNLPGWRMPLAGYSDVAGGGLVSWTIPILPNLDELDVFEWFRTYAASAPAADSDDVRIKRLQRYTCPSVNSIVEVSAPLSYMGNGGTGAEVIRPDWNQYRGDGALLDHVGTNVGAHQYSQATISLSLIGARDGTATTLLITERTGAGSPTDISWTDAPLPAVANANAVPTTHLVLHPPALGAGDYPPSDKRVINGTAETTIAGTSDWQNRFPSSRHVGGVAAVFCDGRTQFMSERIAPWVYCQSLTTDRRSRSPRATAWEVYQVGTDWVRYTFEAKDLNPKE